MSFESKNRDEPASDNNVARTKRKRHESIFVGDCAVSFSCVLLGGPNIKKAFIITRTKGGMEKLKR